MKNLFIILLVAGIYSCSSSKESSTKPQEDEIFIVRKYAGEFIEYRHTGPDNFSELNLVWIKTTMDSTFGKISAYGKKCDFEAGDKLFLTRNYYSPGVISGFWIYNIENDSSLSYRITEYQYDKKVFIPTLFK